MIPSDLLVITIAAFGTAFMLVSAIGLLRLPGVHARMHAVGKASTLGVASILVSAGLYYGGGQLWRMLLLAFLFFVTAPVATSAMARAAYRCNPRHQRYLSYNDLRNPRYRSEHLPLAEGVETSKPANRAET